MDLYLLNELNKLEANGGGSSGSASGSMFLPPDIGADAVDVNSWPMITRLNDRQQTDNWSWTSSSPYTSFYTYGGNGRNDAEFGVYDAIGASYTENGSMDNWTTGTNVNVEFSNGGQNVGCVLHHNTKWSGSNYGPYRTSVMWLKNCSGTTRSFTAYGRFSSQWNSGYEGSSIWIGQPNNADKASVTSVDWSRDSYTGSTTDWQGNVTRGSIPNGVTICILGMNSLYYHQDSSNLASWQDNHMIYNLSGRWDEGWRPDYNMYKTCLLARDGNWNASGGAWNYDHSHRVRNLYRLCAYQFPETP